MPQLVPVNHNLLHQDTIANEFNDILGLSTLFSGLITSWTKGTLLETSTHMLLVETDTLDALIES